MKRGKTPLIGLALAALALTACGGDDDTDEVTVPDLSVPDISVPDISIPDISIPDISIPDISIPDISIPDVSIPDVSDISIPNFEELMTKVQDLPPEQLACIAESGADLASADPTAVFAECGVDLDELLGN